MPRVPLCQLDDLPVGLVRAFEVRGQEIAVFRSREGSLYAVDGRCPHKNGPLADGMLIGDQVVCPLHGYRFDGNGGACDQTNVCGITVYAVVAESGTVYLQVSGA